MSARESAIAPWDDCKVAFGIEDDRPFDNRKLFARAGRCGPHGVRKSPCPLPGGWTLDQVDGAGARWVVVFRVDGVPSVEDGERVAAWLRKIGANP